MWANDELLTVNQLIDSGTFQLGLPRCNCRPTTFV